MARVKDLFPFQWRAYWRGIRSRSVWAGANLSVVLVLGLLMLPGHIAACVMAAMRMRADPLGQGALFTEMLLLGMLIGWLLLPMIAAGVQAKGQALPPARLLQYPLSSRQLFLVGVTGALVQPIYWILLLASACCLIPLLAGPSPWFGLAGGLLFAALAALVSWGITLLGNAVFASRRGREIALSFVSILFIGLLLLAGIDLETEGGNFVLTGYGQSILLANAAGDAGLLTRLRDWTPAAWATRASLGSAAPLALLVALAALAYWMSLWSFNRVIRHPATASAGGDKLKAMGTLPGLPSALGVLARKELNYLARTLDSLLAIALSLGGAVYLILRSEPSVYVLYFGIPVIMSMVMAIPMNCFGLDRKGVDRYRLLPLTGREVILSKNIAYLLISAVQVAPLLLAVTYRFGIAVGAAAVMAAAAYALLLLIWGNAVSVRVPAPREFFNFDSKEQTGGVVSQIYAVLIWGIPGLVALVTWFLSPFLLMLGQAIVLAVCVAIYRSRLARVGRLFEKETETMRDRLAA